MSHVKKHESQDKIIVEQVTVVLAWVLKYHRRNKFSVQKHKPVSHFAHFKIPKEAESKIQHESHASQTSYYFLLN